MAFSHLPTLDAQPARACPKPEPRKRTKGRKDRAEAKVKKSVRAECVERDGDCSVESAFFGHRGWPSDIADDAGGINGWTEGCDGPSEWAHKHERRRSKTRGQAPEVRHDTRYSLMLCRFHHTEYDQKRLLITALTRKGANGPLRFRRAQ